jgi:hypothetical protein
MAMPGTWLIGWEEPEMVSIASEGCSERMKMCRIEIFTNRDCGVCGLKAGNDMPVAFVIEGTHEDQHEECIDCWLSAEGLGYSPEAVQARTGSAGAA